MNVTKMTMDEDELHYKDTEIRQILLDVKSIAIVGASSNWLRPSYSAMKYLLHKGYEVLPVNPKYANEKILGQVTYSSLNSIDRPVDMIDIFRPSDVAQEVVNETLRNKSCLKTKVIWMQLGVKNQFAANLAKQKGIAVVMNRCPKIEYGRLMGELSWAGVNTGIISSKKLAFLND